MKRKCLSILCGILGFLGAALLSQAADLCVLPTATGNGSGADWSNALGAGFTPARGNTYYLGSGTYGKKTFDTAVSGTTLILVLKATETAHGPSNGWTSAMGTGAAQFEAITFSTSHWVFDGITGGGPTAWNSGFGFVVSGTSTVLCTLAGTVSNIAIKHTQFDSDRGTTFIAGIKGTTGACSNIHVSYCAFTEIFGPVFHIGNWKDTLVEYCYAFANKSTPEYHAEGVSSFGNNLNCVWRWNLWDKIEGTAVFAGVNLGLSDGWRIYGNIISRSVTPVYYYWEDPGTNKNEMRNCIIANNTVVTGSGASSGGWSIQRGTNNSAYNNLFYKNDANTFATSITHNYSYASGNVRTSDGYYVKDDEIVSGENAGQITSTSPFRKYDVDPVLADLAGQTTAGFNTATVIAENSKDMYGNVRGGVDNVWDRGAIEFGGPNPTTSAPPGSGTTTPPPTETTPPPPTDTTTPTSPKNVRGKKR